jgi:hypothetical protein
MVTATIRGIGLAIRGRPSIFAGVALGVFAVDLLLPILILSLARGRFTHVAINPWLSRLPEWLRSSDVSLARKFEFVFNMALAWVVANNPTGEMEWGLIVDVPSLARFIFTALMFGTYFALWFYGRDQLSRVTWGARTTRCGGAAGALMAVVGFSTNACRVLEGGVPVLPVVGLAVTGASSATLAFLDDLARVGTALVLFMAAVGVAWLGWLVGTGPRDNRGARHVRDPTQG